MSERLIHQQKDCTLSQTCISESVLGSTAATHQRLREAARFNLNRKNKKLTIEQVLGVKPHPDGLWLNLRRRRDTRCVWLSEDSYDKVYQPSGGRGILLLPVRFYISDDMEDSSRVEAEVAIRTMAPSLLVDVHEETHRLLFAPRREQQYALR